MREFMFITKALADPTRVRLLLALRHGELCACQITELFGLAPSTMSKHLYLLSQAGLAHPRKAGRWVYYSLPEDLDGSLPGEAIQWASRALAKDPRVIQDAKRLAQILKLDPSLLCQRQNQK